MPIENRGAKWSGAAWAGISTFLKVPALEDPTEEDLRSRNVRAAVFGVPFDGGTLGRVGSSLGPRAIRDASSLYSPYHCDYDVGYAEKLNLHDCGDSFIVLGDAKATMENGAALAAEILKAGAMPVILGGEHTVTLAGTIGVDKALEGTYGYIHFDAHIDTASAEEGEGWWHGNHVTLTSELEAFPGENMVLIGLRGTANLPEWRGTIKEKGITCFSMRQVLDMGIGTVVDKALEIVTKGTDGFYLTIDIDVLEPACVPGAQGPTPFGLTARELWSVLPKLGSTDKLKAFDVVEVAPPYDPSNVTAITAAGIIVELLAARAMIN